VKKLREPRKILLKQADRLGVLMQRGNRMNAEGGAAQGVIATDRTANGDKSNRTASEGNTSNCAAPDCNEDTNGAAPKRKQADRQTADRKKTSCQAAKRKPAGRHVPQGKNSASVPTQLSSVPIRTDRDSPKRQAVQLARRLAANAFKRKTGEPLRTQELTLRPGELLWSQRSLSVEPGESFKFFGDAHEMERLKGPNGLRLSSARKGFRGSRESGVGDLRLFMDAPKIVFGFAEVAGTCPSRNLGREPAS
jgi:hypothetical protein